MSVEAYRGSKQEALQQLAKDTILHFKQLQEQGIETQFSFRHLWPGTEQDLSTHPSIPILNQLSRMLSQSVYTWVDYSYKNGELSAELFQNLHSNRVYLIQQTVMIDAEDIPFDKFSENDLIRASTNVELALRDAPHKSNYFNADRLVVENTEF